MNIIQPFRGIKLKNGLSDYLTSINQHSTVEAKINHIHELFHLGILNQDVSPSLYLCQIEHALASYCGFITLLDLNRVNNKIRCHEQTIQDKEKKLFQLFLQYQIQIDPVLMVYQAQNEIEKLLLQIKQRPAEVTMTLPDHRYKLWPINNHRLLNKLNHSFQQVNLFHIADGHHRFSAIRNMNNHKKYLLSMLVSEKNILLKGYNRLIMNIVDHQDVFLNKLKERFYLSSPSVIKKPTQDNYLLYYKKSWINLRIKENNLNLPHYPPLLIDHYFFKDILHIFDQRLCNKIRFIPETEDVYSIQHQVDQNEGEALLLIPSLHLNDFFMLGQKEQLLPPHSTWFEPKVGSGVLSYLMD